jgi:hypothetical protein
MSHHVIHFCFKKNEISEGKAKKVFIIIAPSDMTLSLSLCVLGRCGGGGGEGFDLIAVRVLD